MMLTMKNRRAHQAGFNLIELMVALSIGGILLGVGVPAMSNFMANNRMSAAANEVSAALHMARTEAIKQQANITICPSSDWNATDPSCDLDGDLADGWIMFVDSVPPAAPDLSVDGALVLRAHGPMSDAVTLTAADTADVIDDQQFISFASTGYPVPAVAGNNAIFNFQLCDERGNFNVGGGLAAGRWIQLTPTGRPQIHREQSEIESDANPVGGC